MAITKIKLLHLFNKEQAHQEIIDAMLETEGNMTKAAELLGVSNATLQRMAKTDVDLARKIFQLRKELNEQGIIQYGWGDWHRERSSATD